MYGSQASYTATLLIDDETGETREGTVDGGVDCTDASGPEYEFTYTFERPGEYDLAGEITVDEGSGDRTSIGTVTVTE